MLPALLLLILVASFTQTHSLTPQKSGDKYGYVNERGAWVIPPQYDSADPFRNNAVARVSINMHDGSKLYGLIDTNGEYILPPEFDTIVGGESGTYFGGEDGFYYVYSPSDEEGLSGMGLFDIRYLTLTEPVWYEVMTCDRNEYNLVPVNDMYSSLWGFVDSSSGTLSIPCEFHYVSTFQEGFAIGIDEDNLYVIIHPNGDITHVPDSLAIPYYSFSNGLVPAYDNSLMKWGYMDTSGKITIPCSFDHAQPFENDMAMVCIDDTWYNIDRKGTILR